MRKGSLFSEKISLKLRPKLILIFIVFKVIPLVLVAVIAMTAIVSLGSRLREIAVRDSSEALNKSAVENIERMSTGTAKEVAAFLYGRDADIRLLARGIAPSDAAYKAFSEAKTGRIIRHVDPDAGEWTEDKENNLWQEAGAGAGAPLYNPEKSANGQNNDNDGFNYRAPEEYEYVDVPLYDEITYLDISGQEIYKYVTPLSGPKGTATTKKNSPLSTFKRNVSVTDPETGNYINTYVKAESYFPVLALLDEGEIYVSDVIGAYVGSNYIGMYTEANVNKAAADRGYPIDFDYRAQAYAGKENPNGKRFEGIVRWATPVFDNGVKTGYVTFALNHDHIMEMVDHITPMNSRYTDLSSAYEGNYAFIWDYKCRSICHPRHNSIVGYDAETGYPQTPWLETPIYEAWQAWAQGVKANDPLASPAQLSWGAYSEQNSVPEFNAQDRSKTPAAALTKAGIVGLDGRYLNNAPQCTGWMELTQAGGSGSFYIKWSGLYKLTTAAAIPYYTGQYAPGAANGGSLRGFGFVAIGAGLDDFTRPAAITKARLEEAAGASLKETILIIGPLTFVLVAIVVLVAVWVASSLSSNINQLVAGISRFKAGERQFRLRSRAKDEFGILADSIDELADSVVDSVKSPLCITDLDLNIIYMNDLGLKYINKKSIDEVVGKPYSKNSIYQIGSKDCPIRALKEGGEAVVVFKEDSGQYFKGTASYLTDNRGAQKGYIIATNDVTEIQIARRKAEQASKAKTDFLSNMSHEIRTPLNAIIGMTSIGKAADNLEKKDYSFNKIEDASTHLLGVINDILDMSKIEANKFTLSDAEFNFEKVLERVANVVNFRVEEKKQTFSFYIDPAIPETLYGDDQRLAQVLTNLLSNAVKFTPEKGTITVRSKYLGENADGGLRLLIEVQDTGIGISPEQMPRLFTSFEQAESGTSRKYGGTGLGLVISKSIVEMMGGQISVISETGKGSTFSFTITIRRGAAEAAAGASKPDFASLRALAVDDMPDIREFFTDVAGRIGFKCDVAAGGAEALKLIVEKGGYDIYFIDWNMPGMDGIELSHRIRSLAAGDPKIIMISSVELSEIEGDAKRAGVNKFLQKPLFPNAIRKAIGDSLSVGEKAAETDADADDFSAYRIMLCEDVEINREIVLTVLEPTRIRIDSAENGVQAVRLFSDNSGKYDLIFMDLQMPEMDGLTAARMIRASDIQGSKEVPIIAMTANVFKEDIARCMDAGMNGHIGKPLDIDEVMALLRKYLRKA